MIYKFETSKLSHLDFPAYETLPVFDEYETLIGAFLVINGGILNGFVAGTGFPSAIKISTGETLYLLIRLGSDGRVKDAILSEYFIDSELSIKITMEENNV